MTTTPAAFRHLARAWLAPALAMVLVFGAAPRAAAAPAAPVQAGGDAAREMLALTNNDRAGAGLAPLQWRDDVAAIAADWSQKMAADGTLSHNDAYFSQATADAIGSSYRGENVAFSGSMSAANTALMNSPHHRDNILNPRFNQIGIGAVQDAKGRWWITEDFLDGGAPAPAPAASEAPATPVEAAPEPAPPTDAQPPAPAAAAAVPQARPASTEPAPPSSDPAPVTTVAPIPAATVGVRTAAIGSEVAAAATGPAAAPASAPLALTAFAAALLLADAKALAGAHRRRRVPAGQRTSV